MRKVVVEVYTSLDGVIQPLDWMPPSETGREERGNYARDQLFASDALLMGRETYEIFANTWPSRTAADDGPGEAGYIDRINSLPKFVASTTLKEPLAWNTTLIKGDVAQAVAKLKQCSCLSRASCCSALQYSPTRSTPSTKPSPASSLSGSVTMRR